MAAHPAEGAGPMSMIRVRGATGGAKT
jgi:hypothetical protein